MLINLKQTFKTLQGEDIKIVVDGQETKDLLRFGDVLANIILTPHKDKKGFRPLDALKLARKFANDKEIKLEAVEVVQIRDIIENSDMMPIVQGQLLEVLEN